MSSVSLKSLGLTMFHSGATYALDVLKGKSKDATNQLLISYDMDTCAQHKKLNLNPHTFAVHSRTLAWD